MSTLKCRKPKAGLYVGLLALVFGTVLAFLITPQITFSADVVGGQVNVLEPDVAQQDMQEAQDLDQPEMGAMDFAGDADLTLVVPLQIDNLHLTVDGGRITCQIRKDTGDEEDWTHITAQAREFAIEGGVYSNTFTFYFTAPPDATPDHYYKYACYLGLKESEGEDHFENVWTLGYATEHDIIGGLPQWAIVSDESNLSVNGNINW